MIDFVSYGRSMQDLQKKMVDSSQLILTLLLDVFQPILESFQLINTEPFVKDSAVIVSGAMNCTLWFTGQGGWLLRHSRLSKGFGTIHKQTVKSSSKFVKGQ